MKTVNSISGGKTSAYLSANYKSDYNIFALVTTIDEKCLYPDAKIRQIVSDKIGKEFIGTLEDNIIINTILDLEQFIGSQINWVAGKPFDEIIKRGSKIYLPNVTQRFCTNQMKLQPIFDWWRSEINEPVKMQIGFRANEMSRASTMIDKTNKNGMLEFKTIIGKSKNGNRNKWKLIEWQKPSFPLIEDAIFKDDIEKYWSGKPVRFAYMNNCVGCFHRNHILLKHMSERHPDKFEWFAEQERETGYSTARTFKNGTTYDKIKNFKTQGKLFDDDFNECDSGYCGL